MAGSFGTLRRDSFFSPGEVLSEADQVDRSVKALAAAKFEGGDVDSSGAWNAFVDRWNAFYADCTGLLGWVFRSKNSTRDTLLDFEGEYESWRAQAGADMLPSPNDADGRTPDNLATGAHSLTRPIRNILGDLWPIWLVLAAVGVFYAVRLFRRDA